MHFFDYFKIILEKIKETFKGKKWRTIINDFTFKLRKRFYSFKCK